MHEDTSVDQHRRKRPLAERLHEPGDARIRDERLRFLAQPVALHRRAVRREPAKVSRQLQQQGVDARAADPGRAAHRRVEDLHGPGDRQGGTIVRVGRVLAPGELGGDGRS